MKIYLASSWRNKEFPRVRDLLRSAGNEVYDFTKAATAFHWSALDPEWERWSSATFRDALDHPLADAAFRADMDALEGCEACVLLLPCNRSAHLEAGHAVAAGKRVVVMTDSLERPELMYKMTHAVVLSDEELLAALANPRELTDAEAKLMDVEACYRHLEAGAAHPIVAERMRDERLLTWFKVGENTIKSQRERIEELEKRPKWTGPGPMPDVS